MDALRKSIAAEKGEAADDKGTPAKKGAQKSARRQSAPRAAGQPRFDEPRAQGRLGRHRHNVVIPDRGARRIYAVS